MSEAASPEALSPVHKLSADDETDPFDCGRDELNRFLKRFALANQAANAAQTYVTCRARRVVGYYSLAVGSVQREHSPPRAVKGMARHPVPVMILARLAVDRSDQGSVSAKPFSKMPCYGRRKPPISREFARWSCTQKTRMRAAGTNNSISNRVRPTRFTCSCC